MIPDNATDVYAFNHIVCHWCALAILIAELKFMSITDVIVLFVNVCCNAK